MQHLYAYYHTPENFRRVVLIPRNQFPFIDKPLGELEGMLVTQEEIPSNKLTFPITQQEEVAQKYKGTFMSFDDFR